MAEMTASESQWVKDETTPNIDYWSRKLGKFEARVWLKGRKAGDGYVWEVRQGNSPEATGAAPHRTGAMVRADDKMSESHSSYERFRLGYDRLDAIRDATDAQRPPAKRLVWGGMSTIPKARLGDYEGQLRLDVSKVWEFEIRRIGDVAGPGPVVGYGHEDSLIEAVAAVEDRLHKFKAVADERAKAEEDRKKAAIEEVARLEKEKAERPYTKRLTWTAEAVANLFTCAKGNITAKVQHCDKERWDAEVRVDGKSVFVDCCGSKNAAFGAAENKIDELVKAALAAGAAKAPEKVPEDLSVHTTHVNVAGKIVLSVTWRDVIHPTVPRVYGESNEAGRGIKAEIYLDSDTNRWVWAVGRNGAVGGSGYASALGKAKTDATESIWELIEGENERARKQEELRASVAKAEVSAAERAKRMVEETDELRAILKHFDDQTVAYGSQVRLTRKTDGATIKCDRIEEGPDKGWWTYVVRSGDSMREHRGQAPSRMEAQLGAAWLIHEWARLDVEDLKKDVKVHFEDADKKAAAAQHHAPVTTEDVRKAAEWYANSAEELGIHVLANGNLLFDPLFVAKTALEALGKVRTLSARIGWLMDKIEEVYRRAPACTEDNEGRCDYSDCAECRLDELLEDQEQWAKDTGLAGSDR